MAASKIGWTERSWNPIRAKGGGWGCTKVSTGCANCYAESQNKNTSRGGNGKPFIGQWEFEINERILAEPVHRKKPSTYFVMSMGDLFHEDISRMQRGQVLHTMHCCSHHIFQVLTKRTRAMADCLHGLVTPLGSHVHLGTSVENQEALDERLPHLLRCPAAVRWLSVEPMLGPVFIEPLKLTQVNWIVIGCESRGAYAGRLGGTQEEWLCECDNIVQDCQAHNVPVFVKQIPYRGKVLKRKPGKPWPDAWPEHLRVQEFPIQQGSPA